MDTITPTNFKENIGKVLQEVVHSNSEIEITRDSKNGLNDGVIMISKRNGSCYKKNFIYNERVHGLMYLI